jgi:hypothetical protein
VALGFSGSLISLQTAPIEPNRADVMVVRIGERLAGFTTRAVWGETGQPATNREVTALIVPGSPLPSFNDTVMRTAGDARGVLQRGTYISAVDGSVILRVQVERGAKAYSYTGQRAAQTLEGHFAAERVLTQPAIAARLVSDVLRGTKPSVTAFEYHPGIDPTRPLEIQYTPSAGARTRVSWSYGETPLEGDLDESGWLSRYEAPFGPGVLRADRLLVGASQEGGD